MKKCSSKGIEIIKPGFTRSPDVKPITPLSQWLADVEAREKKALKPCPFCGSHVQYDEDMGAITCVHAKDGCGFFYNCELQFKESRTQWNRRDDTDKLLALVRKYRDALEQVSKRTRLVDGQHYHPTADALLAKDALNFDPREEKR